MLTTEILANELNLSPKTITQWIRQGRIPAIPLPRHWAIPEEVLDEIRENGVPPRDSHPRPVVHRAE
jgi:excisionase family DNA binding protein